MGITIEAMIDKNNGGNFARKPKTQLICTSYAHLKDIYDM